MIVVDASVAIAWVLEDTDENYQYSAEVARAGLERRERSIAPSVLTSECAYVLLKKRNQARWGVVKLAEYGELIDLFRIVLYEVK